MLNEERVQSSETRECNETEESAWHPETLEEHHNLPPGLGLDSLVTGVCRNPKISDRIGIFNQTIFFIVVSAVEHSVESCWEKPGEEAKPDHLVQIRLKVIE